jgi:hypothetical protein
MVGMHLVWPSRGSKSRWKKAAVLVVVAVDAAAIVVAVVDDGAYSRCDCESERGRARAIDGWIVDCRV